ncbi:translocon-associated protein subunit delta-like [Uloborus diversus]|uniref:translocon-associated protein subunit delta-like n=1 Tax=Uloborus diversus TaxID=327109 RepID=UPI00240A3452|nr:translocon-associated protein subunit delta-like [Uloborus diversus]
MMQITVFSSIFLYLVTLAFGEICRNPTVKETSYTTVDGMVVSDVALITEFSVKCDTNVKDLTLYADINGKTFPAVKSQDSTKYQVSWSEDPAKISSGQHNIKIYDEEGFASLRKAQRNGEDISGIPSAFSISVYHAGSYYGPYVQSEFWAAAFSIVLWYIAFSERSKLVA